MAAKKRAKKTAKKSTGKTIVRKTGIKREKGYLYFVTKGGDVAKTKMAGKRRKRK